MAILANAKQKQEIGSRLKSERERLGYSEQQIAQLLGVSPEIYCQIERGELDPGIYSMPRLADIGFDVLYVIMNVRHIPGIEEDALLRRYRSLSLRGKTTIFNTLDALERLGPNIKKKISGSKAASDQDNN